MMLLFGINRTNDSTCPVCTTVLSHNNTVLWTEQNRICGEPSSKICIYCRRHFKTMLNINRREELNPREFWCHTEVSGYNNRLHSLPHLFRYRNPKYLSATVTVGKSLQQPFINDWVVFQISALHEERGLKLLDDAVKPWTPKNDSQWLILRLSDYMSSDILSEVIEALAPMLKNVGASLEPRKHKRVMIQICFSMFDHELSKIFGEVLELLHRCFQWREWERFLFYVGLQPILCIVDENEGHGGDFLHAFVHESRLPRTLQETPWYAINLTSCKVLRITNATENSLKLYWGWPSHALQMTIPNQYDQQAILHTLSTLVMQRPLVRLRLEGKEEVLRFCLHSQSDITTLQNDWWNVACP